MRCHSGGDKRAGSKYCFFYWYDLKKKIGFAIKAKNVIQMVCVKSIYHHYDIKAGPEIYVICYRIKNKNIKNMHESILCEGFFFTQVNNKTHIGVQQLVGTNELVHNCRAAADSVVVLC